MIFPRSLNRQFLRCWLTAVAFMLILSGCSLLNTASTQTPLLKATTPSKVVDTWYNIHAFLTFDGAISKPVDVSNRYDFVWGAEVNHAQALISGNPNIFLTYYMPFHRDVGTFTQNGPVSRPAYWKSTHPDWILYKCDRVTPAYEYGDLSMPLDFANPALVTWQIQTYAMPASVSRYKGIATDNVNLENLFGACGVYKDGKWVQRYTGQLDDPQWRADVITWLTRMHKALHDLPHPMALIPNLSFGGLGPVEPSNPLLQQVLSNVDGVLDEAGFTNFGQGYLSDDDWLLRIELMETVQKQDKPYYVVNRFPSVGPAEIQWALASYLMGKEHTCALFISAARGYGTDAWHKEFYARIGRPSDSMYQWQHVYVRDYSRGLSIVNPSAKNTYTVTLNAFHRYVDLYNNPVGPTIKMPPHSGIVLLLSF